jgi:putative restriction endonuclease
MDDSVAVGTHRTQIAMSVRSEAKSFHVLDLGEPFFFKLKRPHNAIGGFGYFAHFSQLPASIAWEVYGRANGAPTYLAMRHRLAHYRSRFDMDAGARNDFSIGCILINEPTFFADDDWGRVPNDWSGNIVQGKGYDLTAGEGQRLWMECLTRAQSRRLGAEDAPRSTSLQIGDQPLLDLPGGYGAPTTIRPRLGQRSFRVAVLDSYGRRCAVTSERTLPALEAAHIREYADLPEHSLNNGILFRADIHKLSGRGLRHGDP